MIDSVDYYISEGPELYTGDEENYAWANCRCEVPFDHAIKIPREGRSKVFFYFKCKKCGTEGSVFS